MIEPRDPYEAMLCQCAQAIDRLFGEVRPKPEHLGTVCTICGEIRPDVDVDQDGICYDCDLSIEHDDWTVNHSDLFGGE